MRRENYGGAEPVPDVPWRLEWCKLLEGLTVRGHFMADELLTLTVEDGDGDVRKAAVMSLCHLAASGEYAKVLVKHASLNRNLDAATTDLDFDVRAAWASMIAGVSSKEHTWRDGPQTLIHLALEDGHRNVRLAAYEGLTTLITKSKRHDFVGPSLTKAFEMYLKNSSYKPVLEDFRPEYPYAVPVGIVACLIPPLVSYVVERADDDPNVTPEETALMHIAEEGELVHQIALLTNLVESLAARIPGSRCADFAGKLATRIHIRQHPLYPMIPYVRPLAQRLKHTSREVRLTSLTVLIIYYWDCMCISRP
ncbi:hypothetical protein BKA70DRAFT_603305 [Coprinopsis sp. MPI-PUGE-AT-0042]|nr:hypothetical protein BKA70DRAFT_603305 [Coprinopsis sp. MPI-PUGE-AT-0042]